MRSLAPSLLTILLNATWQIALVTLFAASCNWLLRGTAAWCRHSVWVAALVISLGLPIISGLNTLELARVAEREVPSSVRENVIRPGDSPELKQTAPSTINGIALTGTAGVPPATSEAFSPAPSESLNSASVQSNQGGRDARGPSKNERFLVAVNRSTAALLLALYSLFLLYRGIEFWRAWRRTTAIIRSAYAIQITGHAAAIIARCQKALGVKRVGVVCSSSVQLPITAGVFNPLIILPESMLSGADENVLLSAIGHEFVHVARRDYFLNLLYELIYLPISFHPAAALLRRRIKETRELCCDELVAGKLLAPQLYARSLVRLVGSVPLAGRLAPDTTIGITDADILEVRIMSLLKTSKLSPRRNTFLLIAAFLLLAAPCAAAAAFAVQFDIADSQPAVSQPQESRQEASQKLARADQEMARAREELQRKERELVERVRKNPNPQGAELETLRRMERELEEASVKLSHEDAAMQMKQAEQVLRQSQANLAQIIATYPGVETRMREAQARLAQAQQSFPQSAERSRELREQLAKIEKQYPAQMAEHLQSLARAQEEIAQQQAALAQEQREKIKEQLVLKHQKGVARDQKYREALEQYEAATRDLKSKIKNKEYEKTIRKDLDNQIRQELEEAREGRAKEQAELTQLATMSMDRAIQIATSQHPGKVMSCSLGRQKNGQPFYRLVIINGEGEKSSATYVWVSATDGQIIKTEHE